MWYEDDRVVLQEGYFAPARSNPCIGSEFECVGTVVDIIEDDNAYVVVWDNETENTYNGTELKAYTSLSQDNPNKTFVMHSFRKAMEKKDVEIKDRRDKEINSLEQYAAKYFWKDHRGDAES